MVGRQDSLSLRSVLIRIVDLKIISFVGFFFIYFLYVAAFRLFTHFIMKCESNLKVNVDRKQGALAFSYRAALLITEIRPKTLNSKTLKTLKTFFVSQKLLMLHAGSNIDSSIQVCYICRRAHNFDQIINKYNLFWVKMAQSVIGTTPSTRFDDLAFDRGDIKTLGLGLDNI